MLRLRGAGGASATPESYSTDPYGRIGGSFDTMRSMTQFFRRGRGITPDDEDEGAEKGHG